MLLEQRAALLGELRDVSATLAEAGVEHGEFIRAFVAYPADNAHASARAAAREEAAVAAVAAARVLAPVAPDLSAAGQTAQSVQPAPSAQPARPGQPLQPERPLLQAQQARPLQQAQPLQSLQSLQSLQQAQQAQAQQQALAALEDEWPFKRSWIQVLVMVMRGIVVRRSSRLVERIVADRMRAGDGAAAKCTTLTKQWLWVWLGRNVPVHGEVAAGAAAAIASPAVSPAPSPPASPAASPASSPSDKKSSPKRRIEDKEDELSLSWTGALLRHKLRTLLFLRANREWLFRSVPREQPLRKFSGKVRFGSWRHPELPNTQYKAVLSPQGGGGMMLELGARAVTPRPQSCVAVEVVLHERAEDAEGEEISNSEVVELVSEVVDNLVDDELRQVPGYVCARVNIVPNDKERVLRAAFFFTSAVDDLLWVESGSATVTLWPPLASPAEWVTQDKLSFKGLLLEWDVQCRLPEGRSVHAASAELEYGALRGVDNPLAWLRGAAASEGSRTSKLVTRLIETIMMSGLVKELRAVRSCSGQRTLTVVPTNIK